MKSFSELNIEEMARRNPDQNPRIPSYKYLYERYNSKEYFFSFTSIKKIGINPRSSHDTPNGIYTFPAKEIFPLLNGDMKAVPFVDNAPYITVLKKKNKGVVDPLDSYSYSDYDKDVKKIYKLFSKEIKKNPAIETGIDEIIGLSEDGAKFSRAIAWFWNVTRNISADSILAGLKGWGGVKANSKLKDWYSDRARFDKDKHGRNKRKKREEYKGIEYPSTGLSFNAQGWNNLLRSLGYNGFVDRKGTGLIHENEPTQAVFLSTKAFDVVDLIENKSYHNLNITSGLMDKVQKLKKKNKVYIVDDLKLEDDKHIQTLLDADLDHCTIRYNDGRFTIEGGTIKSGTFVNYVYEFINVRIRGGSFYSNRRVNDCIIDGGKFVDCDIVKCIIVGGEFQRCDILKPQSKTINNARMMDCAQDNGIHFYSVVITGSQHALGNVTFSGDCRLQNVKIYNDIKDIISDKKLFISDSEMTGGTILDIRSRENKYHDVVIKGGEYTVDSISFSKIMAGDFQGCDFRETPITGGVVDGNTIG